MTTHFTFESLLDLLQALPVLQARAALFSFETKIAPDRLAELTWADIDKVSELLTPLAVEVLEVQPQRLGTQHVFWEDVKGSPQPIKDLPRLLIEKSGLSWLDLLTIYEARPRKLGKWDDAALQM